MNENDATFEKELEALLNNHSMENGSDTPDFILAAYLGACLKAFEAAVDRRGEWYGRTIEEWRGADSVPPRTPRRTRRMGWKRYWRRNDAAGGKED